MLRQSFNDRWTVTSGKVSMMDMFSGGKAEETFITLPHDAMILEERRRDTKNAHQTGFYPGGLYTYKKTFTAPEEWRGKSVAFEFEGVANFARVFINGNFAGMCRNPYRNFTVFAENFLKFGTENELRVEINNLEETSRWYPGGGIYRNMNLLVGGPVRLSLDGLRVTTEVSGNVATVCVRTELINDGLERKKVTLETTILDGENRVVGRDTIPVTAYGQDTQISRQRVPVKDPALWDDEHPNLYRCEVRVLNGEELIDEDGCRFGIRTMTLSPETGLLINGREVKLRGSCVHHDNGIIGAVTLPAAEYRKCKLLKEAGFNCIRSAHHPASRALLDACDELGLYVMDELSDMWTRTKNPNDYANQFPDEWERDVEAMVAKDFNHPSVILYSTGNEIQEAGTARGAWWNRRINDKLKALDDTRYTTCGINGYFAAGERMMEVVLPILERFGISPEPPAEGAENGGAGAGAPADGGAGADEVNSMMSFMTGPIADAISTSPVLTELLDEFVSAMDIAGYNYLTALHEAEKTLHPNRVVLGTETYPADIVRLWDIVKRNRHVVGDMTWTGYDYLGEAGCGIFYYDGSQNFSAHWPDRAAYIGDIDLAGTRRPISYLREIVFGLRKTPYMAVLRMDRNGQTHSQTPWMWKDNIASWTWPGHEGETASVDVYTDADEVALFLNGQCVAKKAPDSPFVATFEVSYAPGTLTAVAYRNGVKTGRFSLETAGEPVALHAEADKRVLKADKADLAYITVTLSDRDGKLNLNAQRTVSIEVTGAGTLQGFGSGDPQSETPYFAREWRTYDGYLLAAIRSTGEAGPITVTLRCEGCEDAVIALEAKIE